MIVREWPTRNKRIKHGIGITHPRFYASVTFAARPHFDLYQSKSWAEDEYQWQFYAGLGFLLFRVAIMKSCFAWSYYGTDAPADMDKYFIVYVDTKYGTDGHAHAHCYRHALEIARDMPLGNILRGGVFIFRRPMAGARYGRIPVYERTFSSATWLRSR